MINKLKKDFNTSMIMISHNLGVIAEVCDDLAKEKERLSPISGLLPDPSSLPAGCHFVLRCPYATEKCSSEKKVLIEIEPGGVTYLHL
jgi:peptide/nickel transport system ATP-binding protein